MNPSTDQAIVDELAPPAQPHRLSTSCDLHPDERFSGFCPSCLCDRLSVLDHNAAPTPSSSSSKKPPTISAASLKALFKPSSSGTNTNNNNVSSGNGRVRTGLFPELRRTKSFSAKINEGFSSGFEPQRRSCDVRLRDEHRNLHEAATVIVSGGKNEDEPRKSSVSGTVFEAEIEEEEEKGGHSEIVEVSGEEKSDKIVEEELKPMKDYMDLYSQTKKPSVKDFAGSFFSAASVFSKKLQKWRHKQKIKKPRSGDRSEGVRPQSEIGVGRRSNDTDPRFSLDAGRFSVDIGRISLDDSRYSIDEPRASWDGHLIGRTTAARVPPPPSMLSVMGNAPIHRSDMQIPVEGPSVNNESNLVIKESDSVTIIPGGSNQTRDYYTEPPSSRRRKSIDRSNSIRKTVATELDEVISVSNSKASPATTTIDSNSMEMAKGNPNDDKKSRRWGKWSILGFIYKKGKDDDEEEEEDRYSRSNSAGMAERSLSESWPEMRNGGEGPKMRRSNSNASWRSSGGGSVRNKSSRYSSRDGENGMLRFYLTPMRSNWRSGGGGGGGGGGGWEKTAAKANSHGHSIARRVMRLY